MTAKPRPLCGVGVECYRGLCELFSLTSAGAVVRVQQVTVATGAIEASDVVVTEVVAEQVLIGAVAALVHIWTKTDERQHPKRQNAPPPEDTVIQDEETNRFGSCEGLKTKHPS